MNDFIAYLLHHGATNARGLNQSDHGATNAPRVRADSGSALLDNLALVRDEVYCAQVAWPAFNSAHEGFAVLLEEVDELKAHVWTNQKKRDLGAMHKEAMQVAAMALRFMEECCDEVNGRK